MINLLPPEYRLHLRYGRLNARLFRWLIIGLILATGLAVILAASWLYMDQEINSLQKEVTATKTQLKEQELEKVQKQADEISQNVRAIDQLLRSEIRFSALLQEIGKVMPEGAVLKSLTITKVVGALDLEASTRDQQIAAQLAANLSDPKNNIFETVDIIEIKCGPPSAYPCSAKYKVLFGKNTPNRFLNVATEGSS